MSSKSNPDPNDHHEPHPWLEEKVYAKLRQRTIDLVKQSVDTLLKDKQRISLSTVVAKSRELDTEGNGKGISESAILDNQEARAYYQQHRSWRGSSRKRAKPLVVASPTQLPAVKPGRDEQRVRQRYLRMSKEALVERLITLNVHWLSNESVGYHSRMTCSAFDFALSRRKSDSRGFIGTKRRYAHRWKQG